jgi:hypothetical protein
VKTKRLWTPPHSSLGGFAVFGSSLVVLLIFVSFGRHHPARVKGSGSRSDSIRQRFPLGFVGFAPDGAVFTNPRLADFRVGTPVTPRELASGRSVTCPSRLSHSAWVSIGKQRWVTSRKRRRIAVGNSPFRYQSAWSATNGDRKLSTRAQYGVSIRDAMEDKHVLSTKTVPFLRSRLPATNQRTQRYARGGFKMSQSFIRLSAAANVHQIERTELV